jgi:hypothetical protein
MRRPKKNNKLQINKNVEVLMTKASDETAEKIKQHKEDIVQMNEEIILEGINTEIDVSRLELEKIKIEIEERREALKKLESRQYDAKETAISEKQITKGHEAKAVKEKIARQKAQDNEKVTGRFMNRRAPGQPAKLAYIKYEDDPVKWYEFNDGVTYTIPRGFADQINDHYYTPHFIKNEGIMNPDNPESGIASVDNTNKKYAFVAVGY